MKIHFSPLFFQPVEPLPDQMAIEDQGNISYAPEKYGTWDNFLRHPDYEQARQQYIRIFTEISHLITEHARHPEPQQMAFQEFITRLFEGYFLDRELLIYGEGKRLFDTFHRLVMHREIALENRLAAIRNLSQELRFCVDGAISSLIGTVRQLKYSTADNLAEALRVKEQLVEQLIREFNLRKAIRIGMEKHYVAVYHNFLRPRYGLPSLEHDIHADQTSLRITSQDLEACAQYVAQRLTPLRIVSIMAETYLGEVGQALGRGQPFREAVDTLTALKTRLTPIYGDIPDYLLLIEGSDRLYHPPGRDTLIRLTLLQTLHKHGMVEGDFLNDSLYVRYHTPDTRTAHFIPAPAVRSEETQVIPQGAVAIHHTDTLWWVWIEGESVPTLLALTHLLPLVDSAPHLSVQDTFNLFYEAIRNSSADEQTQALPILITNPYFLHPYLAVLFEGRKEALWRIMADLFFTHDLSQGTVRYEALRQTFEQLGLNPQFVEERWKEDVPRGLLKMLFNIFLQPGRAFPPSRTILLNILFLEENLHPRLNLSHESILFLAAREGWAELLDRLCQPGVTNLNAFNRYGQTALMIAAGKGDILMMEHLMQAGADVARISQSGDNALSYAVTTGQVAAADYLLNLRIQGEPVFDINARNRAGMPLLFQLFKEPYTPSVEARQEILALLLRHGADVHARTDDGRSVLSMDGIFPADCFEALLAAGADPYGEDFTDILQNAIQNQEEIVAVQLIQQVLADRGEFPLKGADILIDIAMETDQIQLAIQLMPYLQQGLSFTDRAFALDKLSNTALPHPQTEAFARLLLQPEWIQGTDEASNTFFDAWLDNVKDYTGQVGTASLLTQLSFLVQYTDIHQPMKSGDTLLMHLVKHATAYTSKPETEDFIFSDDLYPMIKYLATHTDLLSRPDQHGLTPFLWAVRLAQAKVIQLLLMVNTALVHSRDSQGNTPLHIATDTCQPETIHLLLHYGAQINARNNKGQTALMLARLRGYPAAVEALHQYGAETMPDKAISHPASRG